MSECRRPRFALGTVQLHWGGLFDCNSADGLVHLDDPQSGRHLLCGLDLFAKDGPGFSRGGGNTGPGVEHRPCAVCAAAARERYPGMPIAGMLEQSEPMAAAAGVDAFGHVWDVPARREYDAERSREREQAWASGRSGVMFG